MNIFSRCKFSDERTYQQSARSPLSRPSRQRSTLSVVQATARQSKGQWTSYMWKNKHSSFLFFSWSYQTIVAFQVRFCSNVWLLVVAVLSHQGGLLSRECVPSWHDPRRCPWEFQWLGKDSRTRRKMRTQTCLGMAVKRENWLISYSVTILSPDTSRSRYVLLIWLILLWF